MATSNPNIVCDSSTTANFNAWAGAIAAFIINPSGGGWIQSTDTGQATFPVGSAPGSGAYVYQIYEPNDSLANFFLKVEYGNLSGTNCPTIRLSLGTATNGAGVLTGTVMGPFTTNQNAFTAPSASIQYPCYFSGEPGRLSFMLWRNGGNTCSQLFAVERSRNASGTTTSSYVTLMMAGSINSSDGRQPYGQQTLVFGIGVAPQASIQTSGGSNTGGIPTRTFSYNTGANGAFNAAIGLDTAAPYIGYWDYPTTCIATAPNGNISEGQTVTTTLYSATRTYIFTIAADLNKSGYAGGNVASSTAVGVRFD